jgi:transaldolase
MTSTNALFRVRGFGQSVWLADFHREAAFSGELRQLVLKDGVRGTSSPPRQLRSLIQASADYDSVIADLARRGLESPSIHRALMVDDVQHAADALRPMYDESGGADGYACISVSPFHTRADAIYREALELWSALSRPNVMVQIPASDEGLSALRHLTAEGMNADVLYVFSRMRVQQVARAYIDGLEARAAQGKSLHHVASVARFDLSAIDRWLADRLDDERDGSLRDRLGVALAKIAHAEHRDLFCAASFRVLGARVQRLVFSGLGGGGDVSKIEALIGSDSVLALTTEEIRAYRDHGEPAPRLLEDLGSARAMLEQVQALGIDLETAGEDLTNEALDQAQRDHEQLVAAVEAKRRATLGDGALR